MNKEEEQAEKYDYQKLDGFEFPRKKTVQLTEEKLSEKSKMYKYFQSVISRSRRRS